MEHAKFEKRCTMSTKNSVAIDLGGEVSKVYIVLLSSFVTSLITFIVVGDTQFATSFFASSSR